MASRLPFPLTDAGKADAELIASQLFGTVALDRIISSPFSGPGRPPNPLPADTDFPSKRTNA